MKQAYWIALGFGIGFCICLAAQQIRPFLLFVLGGAVAFLGLVSLAIAAFIKGWASWRKESKWWVGPALVCVGFICTAPVDRVIGNVVADLEFRSHLPEYSKMIEDIKGGAIPCKAELEEIDAKLVHVPAVSVKAARYPDGAVIVVVVTGTGFPLLHIGYVYDGSGGNKDCAGQFKSLEDKWYMRKVSEGWYHFSG